MKINKQHLVMSAVVAAAIVAPTTALASAAGGGGGIFGLINWFNELFRNLQAFFGYLLALMGIIAMGFGVWNIIQHFRTESRDDPNQKSRLVFGLVSFVAGIFLAGGAYQQIGSQENFETGNIIFDHEAVQDIAHNNAANDPYHNLRVI